jgi:hypothetical protein
MASAGKREKMERNTRALQATPCRTRERESGEHWASKRTDRDGLDVGDAEAEDIGERARDRVGEDRRRSKELQAEQEDRHRHLHSEETDAHAWRQTRRTNGSPDRCVTLCTPFV